MTATAPAPLPPAIRSRTVTAILGPTNTGKTHLAIERMVGHKSGVIGLPLRLLAREVYGRIVDRAGADSVALVTGEERIVPADPRYWVCTVEAMPRQTDAAFVAIDEVQIAGALERGHVFTDRILNLRGTEETLLLGAATIRPLLEKLLPGLNVVTRPRMSVLTYAGQKKITRLPVRSAVVAFSSDEVYAIAELIKRQRGGAAVVMGSLSPRTRNAQVKLFQAGDVDFLVATDAIGMGLNLDVDHVAFAANRKFDGYQFRALTPAELGQIAGRAGRHMRDGTFGVTGRVAPFEDSLVEALESHAFEPLRMLQWRNAQLDFATIETLQASLDQIPSEPGLTRAPPAPDLTALDHAARNDAIRSLTTDSKAVGLLWDVCQVPDYRKIAPANHAELVEDIYCHLRQDGRLPEDWFARQVDHADKAEGDIDTLANRIAHIRTWTFVANRADWLDDPDYWRQRTGSVEDRLSDALHEKLTQRFVDRRTSVLMRRLRENAMLEAEITGLGEVRVEGQHVGHLNGFRFRPESHADNADGKALRAAAMKALASEIDARADRLAAAPNNDFVLSSDGALRWRGEEVAKLTGGADALHPNIVILADEHLSGPSRDKVQDRLQLWLTNRIETLLKPLVDLASAADLDGLARGLAFRIVENLGIVRRQDVADDVRQIDQTARAVMRRYGVRFGAYNIYVPVLLKPAPSELMALLWALSHGGPDINGLAELPQLSASGRTSIPIDKAIEGGLYAVVGYQLCGGRAVRIDILERLADLIRPILSWRPGPAGDEPPEGAVAGGGFTVTVAMTSLLGCSGEDFNSVLRALGYRLERRRIAPRADTGEQQPATDAAADAGKSPQDGKDAESPPIAAEDSAAESAAPEGADAPGPPADHSEPATAPQVTEEAPISALEKDAAPAADDSQELPDAAPAPVDALDAAAPSQGEAAPDQAANSGPQADATANAGKEPAAAAEPASDEPQYLEIWRPGRSDRRKSEGAGKRHKGAKAGRQNRRDGRPPSGKGGPGRSGNKSRKTGSDKPKQPAVDPDSPFAALAGLKAQLEKDGE